MAAQPQKSTGEQFSLRLKAFYAALFLVLGVQLPFLPVWLTAKGLDAGAIGIVLAILWLDEYVDVPFRFLGALKTPARPQEFWFEALTVLFVATAVVLSTLWVFRRLRVLESLIEVCAWCRKVNVGEKWVPFEQYMKVEHDVKSTHGICPECYEKVVKPELDQYLASGGKTPGEMS